LERLTRRSQFAGVVPSEAASCEKDRPSSDIFPKAQNLFAKKILLQG
jgi:hypothetical protein